MRATSLSTRLGVLRLGGWTGSCNRVAKALTAAARHVTINKNQQGALSPWDDLDRRRLDCGPVLGCLRGD